MTPRRLVVWILGAAIAVVLIVTGIVGILTKAR
jgi:quinol-cytochrome oxidoreductase complex cytochrome b subunit